MKKPYRLILKLVFSIVILIGSYLAIIILIGTLTDYKPDEVTEIETHCKTSTGNVADSTFTFISWNIGFCGLGAEMDFFYDGGKMVRPSPDMVKKYTSGVLDFLKSNDSIDFFFLQEVDKNSARTGKQDETKLIAEEMPNHCSSYGSNYKVQFVPVPFINPLGKVEMGQMILSKYAPENAQRYSYFSAYAWPKRLFMLDRCFIVSRFNLSNGKQLVLLNTHNSAYDQNGKLRQIEMPLIRDFMLAEFEKGNFVVAGGDWNQNPPVFDKNDVISNYKEVDGIKMNSHIFPENWEIAYDKVNPTNREIDAPLTPGKTEVTTIDFYILSPNIKLEEIKVLSQNFQNSDHEPVYLKIGVR